MTTSLPNLLSWSRIVLAPVIAILHLAPGAWKVAGVAIYVFAALSDCADGIIARRYRLGDSFGVFLDPVADKVLVITVLLTLIAVPEPVAPRGLLVLLAGLVILREVVQSSLRDWMARAGRTTEVAVTGLSKTKTIMQLIALGLLLGHDAAIAIDWQAWWFWLAPVGTTLLAGAAVLGLVTLAQFLRVAFRSREG